MTFQLKVYQERCLEVLHEYFGRSTEVGAKRAFNERDDLLAKYHEVAQLPDLPYICVRVPTGGGKTVLAAHAVGVATRTYLMTDRCVVLWLAPTNAIVEQTLKALRDRTHPYRQALDRDSGGHVEVLSLSEALYLTRAVLDGATTVIVSTLAAMRVEDTDGRRVYESNGALEHHFTGLTSLQQARLEQSNGLVSFSLANVLRLRCPIVVMDEAHNARTSLSFDTLKRIGPACIIEFTATPDQQNNPSNVLYAVSAAELKAEQMIKLPIRMISRAQWKEAVSEAITRQGQLEEIAKQEEKSSGEYVRPIVLFHAQPRREGHETVTVEVLKNSLLEDFKIPPEQVAEGTSQKWEIPENLLTRNSAVRFILTVAALREGWDCPYAYILCSVSNLSSRGAVEQILGRVLRLPHARTKLHPELNVAYAYATSDQFVEAARSLEEALVDSGFTKFEAHASIEPETQLPFSQTGAHLFGVPVSEAITVAPSLDDLPDTLSKAIKVEPPTPGNLNFQLIYSGPPITREQERMLKATLTQEEDKKAVERLARKSWGLPIHPAAMGEAMSVPWLAVRVGEQLEIFEDQFRDAQWNIADCDPSLTEAEFSVKGPSGKEAQVDINARGEVRIQFLQELREQLSFNDLRGPKTESELADWLDRAIEHPDIIQVQSSIFLRRMIDDLIVKRGIQLVEVLGSRFRLRDIAARKIDQHRTKFLTESYQRVLLPEARTPLVVSPDCCFRYPKDNYPANRTYQGSVTFPKHYYERPADMNNEESACAALIDSLDEVKYWVRNLERRADCAFWLQTSTDKFYPDFVALLKDGRHFVVEYKREDMMTTEDTKEKKAIGELWEARSEGRCIFRLVGANNMSQVLRKTVSKKDRS
jgi:type III restriction enzyme